MTKKKPQFLVRKVELLDVKPDIWRITFVHQKTGEEVEHDIKL